MLRRKKIQKTEKEKYPPRSTNKKIRISAYAAEKQLQKQEPRVNMITNWLNTRHRQNGFGEDFELTLIPRRAR